MEGLTRTARYRYRIYPTGVQVREMAKVFGHVRWVYNEALRVKGEHYRETGESLSYGTCRLP